MPNRSLFDIITDAGLTAGLQFCPDAGDSVSYPGSGQIVADRVGGANLFLGVTGTVTTDDPTFAGTAGGLGMGDRFTLDGGDMFRLAVANPTWVRSLHQNGAKFTALIAVKYKASATAQALLGTIGSALTNAGIALYTGGGTLNFAVGNGGGTTLAVSPLSTPTSDSYMVVALSVDENGGAGASFAFLNGAVATFNGNYPTPAGGNAQATLEVMARGGGNTKALAGSEFFACAIWTGVALTALQIGTLYNALALRLGLVVDPATLDEPIYAVGALPVASPDEPVVAEDEDLLRLDQGPVIDMVYLLELTLFAPAAASLPGGDIIGMAPVATFPVAAFDEPTGVSAPVMFYYSDIGWTGEPDDPDASNRHYAPRIAQGGTLRLDRSIPITPDAARRALLQLGDITLVNGDRALDDMVRRMAIDGRTVKLLCGKPTDRYADFETIFLGTASSWKLASDGSVALTLRDASWQLDAPAQRNLYDGTGLAGGGLDIKNKPKPLCYGECLSVPLVFIDTTNLVLQGHDGQIDAVLAVYDSGLALTPGIDVPDIWAASPPVAGSYIIQKSGGYIRLGAKPQGTITADIRGDKAFGLYVSTAGGIAFRIAHDRGGLADDKFNLTSFEILNNAQPSPIGIYTGLNTFTIADLWDAIFASIGGWYGANRRDKIEVGRLELPTDAPKARLGTQDITDLQLQDTPTTINPPLYKVLVGYQRNWTPQLTSIAGAVTADRLAFLANEYRYGTFQDPDLTVAHLRAQEITLPGLFANEADADAEAQRLQKLYAGPFQKAQLTTKLQGYLIPLDETINTDYPRYGLAGGKNVIVTGQGIDGSRNESSIEFLF